MAVLASTAVTLLAAGVAGIGLGFGLVIGAEIVRRLRRSMRDPE